MNPYGARHCMHLRAARAVMDRWLAWSLSACAYGSDLLLTV